MQVIQSQGVWHVVIFPTVGHADQTQELPQLEIQT